MSAVAGGFALGSRGEATLAEELAIQSSLEVTDLTKDGQELIIQGSGASPR